MTCPTPSKIAHAVRAGAAAHARAARLVGGPPDLRPYLCCCGAWHVGRALAREVGVVTPAEALAGVMRKHPDRLAGFILDACYKWRETGDDRHLRRMADSLIMTARLHATPGYRKSLRRARREELLYRLRLKRRRSYDVTELLDHYRRGTPKPKPLTARQRRKREAS